MSENKHTPAITGFDAEFLSKRLGRVCARLGIAHPFGDNHESNAEVAGTTLAAVDRAIESLVKQRDEALAAANQCRLDLVTQIHELADHIDRAEYCIADPDMLKQINGQRQYAMAIANKWNQNGNPFVAIASAKGGA